MLLAGKARPKCSYKSIRSTVKVTEQFFLLLHSLCKVWTLKFPSDVNTATGHPQPRTFPHINYYLIFGSFLFLSSLLFYHPQYF
jgi:hypothetical protein